MEMMVDLEGLIYGYDNDWKIIYCPLIGEIIIDGTTKIISKCGRPSIGKWCKFKAQRLENEKWHAERVELMAYPRLKYVIKAGECIIDGTAVVCNIENDHKWAYLWNDLIGFIDVEGEMVKQLKPLTAIEFQAVPRKVRNSPAYFTASKVTVESGSVFQSDLLMFARNAEIKADGRAHVSDCVITLLDEAYSVPPAVGTTISVLYYKQHNDSTLGVGIYATTDRSIIAGIGEDFFTTERYCVTNFESSDNLESTEECDEIFSDAHEDLSMILNQSPPKKSEALNVDTDMFNAPSESIVEFAETDESNHSSTEVSSLANKSDDSTEQIFELSLSFASLTVGSELDPDDQSSSNKLTKEASDEGLEMLYSDPELPISSEDFIPGRMKTELENVHEAKQAMDEKLDMLCSVPKVDLENTVAATDDSASEISGASQEDLWDNEFIEHLKIKMKELKTTQDEGDATRSKVVIDEQIDQSISNEVNNQSVVDEVTDHSAVKSGKEKLRDEMNLIRGVLEERLASMRRTQSTVSTELEDIDGTNRNSPTSSRTAKPTNKMNLKSKGHLEESDEVGTASVTTWTEEVYGLCIEVLSNSRLRNFVSVNKNGIALLRDVMKYLEHRLTAEEVSKELGIPLSELTPECFDMVHEEQASKICREFMEMVGFERIAGRKIPHIPEQIR